MMSEQLFDVCAHIPLLQWLARGSLKQNLLRAIRLWVWLGILYSHRLNLNEPFTYASWRDTFFTVTHPKGEAIPQLHDRNCPCAKTAADWLFKPQTDLSEKEWKRSLLAYDEIPDLDKVLQQRLFGVTRRTLQADLHILADLGWLRRQGSNYYRVKKFPSHPLPESAESNDARYTLPALNPDLEIIVQNLSQPIAGVQRFFLELPYIVSQDKQDWVEDWQERLKKLWHQKPIPPIQLIYNSARQKQLVKCIVYPVCVCYAQRAVYLSAFGQTPNGEGKWYNYRLDKIEKIIELAWSNSDIPKFLLKNYQQNTLPAPEYVKEQMEIAWGFDFYLPPKLMLLRFDREFSDRYIKGTFRHETFARVTYQEAENLICKHAPKSEYQKLLNLLRARSRDDAYYKVDYRDEDTNVGLRLRSWRPRCEVIFPLELRETIAKEVAAEANLYLDET